MKGGSIGPWEWLGKADILPWHAAPSTLILAGKQKLTHSFMQVQEGWSLPCQGSMDDMLISLSYPTTDA
jgi:hypothetical protein